jgi:hypothetical protein
VSELRGEIDDLVARAEERRGRLNGLMPTLYKRRGKPPGQHRLRRCCTTPRPGEELHAGGIGVK